MTERIWFCKVGGETDFFEKAADAPMRRAIAKAFREITGRDPQFTFSGWGGELTEGERAVVENREPKQCEIDHPHYYACKHCGIGPPTAERPAPETRPCPRPEGCKDRDRCASSDHCSKMETVVKCPECNATSADDCYFNDGKPPPALCKYPAQMCNAVLSVSLGSELRCGRPQGHDGMHHP